MGVPGDRLSVDRRRDLRTTNCGVVWRLFRGVHVLAALRLALSVRARQFDRDVPRGWGAAGDPVDARAEIVDDPERSRGETRVWAGGLACDSSRDEVTEPSRRRTCTRSSATGRIGWWGSRRSRRCRMASYAAGTRFLSLIGGVILSFYDWYADLPPASPQVFGDQTDVPESGDWWNADYLIICTRSDGRVIRRRSDRRRAGSGRRLQ